MGVVGEGGEGDVRNGFGIGGDGWEGKGGMKGDGEGGMRVKGEEEVVGQGREGGG